MVALNPIRTEIRATLAVAAPLCAANLAQMTMGFTDTVMVGRLGGLALAAAGLGSLVYFTTGFVLQGVISAVSPLAAHALGTGDRDAAGRIAGQGLALAGLLSLPLAAVGMTFDRVLLAIGYDTALATEIGRFLSAIVWGTPALLGFAALRSLLAALSHTRAVMIILLCCVPANAALNWLLIYGHLGLPSLGVAGAGVASAIVQWLMFGGLALYAGALPCLASLAVFRGALRLRWDDIADMLRLGAPIGVLLAIEVSALVVIALWMGLIGTGALAAHQIVLNVATITYMVPIGIAQAATVRCAFELGAGRPCAARRAGLTALALGASFMTAAAIVLWTTPHAIIAVYLDVEASANAGAAAIALDLMRVAAVFQVFDGMQAVAAGALRGYKDTRTPMLLAGIGYWGIGLIGGWWLAFPLGYGALGLWSGLALGLAVVAAFLSMRLLALATDVPMKLTHDRCNRLRRTASPRLGRGSG
jgi:multidrug resistance protein, MATE family